MKYLRDLEQILAEHEFPQMQKTLGDSVPVDVLEQISLYPKNLEQEVSSLEQQLGVEFSLPLRSFFKSYDLTSASVLSLSFNFSPLSALNHQYFIQSLGLLPLGVDPTENHYYLKLSDESLHAHGPEVPPAEHFIVACSLIKWFQVFDAYSWEEFPALPETEFEDICQYLGVQSENPYWQKLYQLGEPIL